MKRRPVQGAILDCAESASTAVCQNKVRIIFDAEIDEVIYPSQASDTKRPMSIKLRQPGSGIKKMLASLSLGQAFLQHTDIKPDLIAREFDQAARLLIATS